MPSRLHEALLLLFRNRPRLAARMVRDTLRTSLPKHTDARLDAAELTDIQPAEYRADLVVLLLNKKPVHGIIIEVQLRCDDRKRYAWPVYVTNLRARLRCPVSLLVVAATSGVAHWAGQRVCLGSGNYFRPLVLAPTSVPKVTSERDAHADPELAVLSAIAHGKKAKTRTAVRIARVAAAACLKLEEDRSKLYGDLIIHSLSAAAREAFRSVDMKNYQYQSAFARRYVRQGERQGMIKGVARGMRAGQAEMLSRLLEKRFGVLSSRLRSRLAQATAEQLGEVAERILTARTAGEALRKKRR